MMKQLLFLLVFFFVGLGLSGCASRLAPTTSKPVSAEISPDVLFIAYDYGDALAFKAVIPYLKSRQMHVKILVFGAAEKALKDFSGSVTLTSLLTMEQKNKYAQLIKDWQMSRTVALPDVVLKDVVSRLDPRVVVTGMAHAIQAQLTNQLAIKGAYSIAFYDNFDAPDTQAFVQPWLAATFGVNEVFLPGDYLINSFLKLKPLSGSELTVVGQPALEDWAKSIQGINREAVIKQLTLKAGEPVIVYAAGYDLDSLSWLNKFLEVAASRPDMQIIIALHPKMNGRLGTELEKKVKALSNVMLAPQGISTEELASISNLLVTHKSTVGVKAAYAGIPVLYVAESSYQNILTEHHLALRASSWSEIMNAVHRSLDQDLPTLVALKKLGMPSQPVVRFDGRLLDILKGLKRTPKMPVLKHVQFEEKQ